MQHYLWEQGEPKAMATETGGIYWLDLRQETAKVAVMTPSLDLLHRRLGHLGQQNFHHLQGKVRGKNLKEESFDSCVAYFKGKQSRAPFRKGKAEHATKKWRL
jgi:hypothetical protein